MLNSLRETWHDWLVSWHRWWRETHLQAATSATDDALAFSLPADDDAVISDKPRANAETSRLLEIAEVERGKVERHTARLYELLDKRVRRLVR